MAQHAPAPDSTLAPEGTQPRAVGEGDEPKILAGPIGANNHALDLDARRL